MADDLLVARGLVVAYGRPAAMFPRRSVAPAVLYGIDIHVGKGETVGIVGESGSGKTTLGRALLGLVKPVAGSVIFDGRDITALDEKARRPLRRRMQMIFQDPMSSLNPRHTIGRILTAWLRLLNADPSPGRQSFSARSQNMPECLTLTIL